MKMLTDIFVLLLILLLSLFFAVNMMVSGATVLFIIVAMAFLGMSIFNDVLTTFFVMSFSLLIFDIYRANNIANDFFRSLLPSIFGLISCGAWIWIGSRMMQVNLEGNMLESYAAPVGAWLIAANLWFAIFHALLCVPKWRKMAHEATVELTQRAAAKNEL